MTNQLPMRGQYPGHVITLDQSEASISQIKAMLPLCESENFARYGLRKLIAEDSSLPVCHNNNL